MSDPKFMVGSHIRATAIEGRDTLLVAGIIVDRLVNTHTPSGNPEHCYQVYPSGVIENGEPLSHSSWELTYTFSEDEIVMVAALLSDISPAMVHTLIDDATIADNFMRRQLAIIVREIDSQLFTIAKAEAASPLLQDTGLKLQQMMWGTVEK